MLKKCKFPVFVALVLTLIMTVLSGCNKLSEKQSIVATEKMSFRDIPGISWDEINGIGALSGKKDALVYGVSLSTDAFIGKDGQIQGFAALLCDWLTGIFPIPIIPVLYERDDLAQGLESGEIDFTSELILSPEQRETLFTTSAIAEHTVKIYRRNAIFVGKRMTRYAFLKGSVLDAEVKKSAGYLFETVFVGDDGVAHRMLKKNNFETVFVDDYDAAYRMLKSGEIDGYIDMDTAEAAFDHYGDMASEDFLLLIFGSSCLSTRKAELQPIIAVVEKALDGPTLEYLDRLRKAGHKQYLEHKLFNQLTEEERVYIRNNPVIPVAVESGNYPVCFYNTYANQWQGIFFDALDEISQLTGLAFNRVNEQNASNNELIAMLENGEALILPELFRLKEYEYRFLWSDVPLWVDNFAFLSRSDFPNIDINQIVNLTAAIWGNSIYSEYYKKMFSNSGRIKEYDAQENVYDALKKGDADLIFSSRRRPIMFTNYNEDADFKLNLVLNQSFDTSFGYNKHAVLLKSIIDKSLRLINVNNISSQWMHKSYDYRNKLTAAHRSWLTGAACLFLIVLILVSVFLIRSRSAGKRLEDLVKQRTGDLAFETSKFQAVFASIPELMFCKDTDLKYTQCNRSFEQFMGVNEADILGKTNRDGTWFPSEQVEKIHSMERTVIDEDHILIFEEKIISPVTGEECVFETVKAPIRQDGVVAGIVAIIRDITQRKTMERDLAYQTSLFKTILNSLPDAVFCKNLNFKYTLCNNYMAGLFGKTQEDILGKDDIAALGLSPETAKIAAETDLKVMNERQRISYEEWVSCSDGVTRLYETVKSPLVLDDAVIGIMAIGRDITERKKIERELAFKTSQLQMTIASIPDLLFCKDTNLRYTQCNKFFEQFIGVSEADILGKTDKDGTWLPPEEAERIHNMERTVIDEDRILTLEEKVRSQFTGKECVFETIKAPIRQDGAVVGIIAIIRDITRRKEMEEEVMAASHAKSSFLANMSHELRTPLNVVIGLTDLILEDDMTNHVRDNLIKISNAGTTLLSIVNDILDFSKIESGKLTLSPVEYYISSLLNDIITLVVTRLGEKPITFRLDIKDDLPNKLFGDDLRVKQILTNLLTNAIKYTRQGSIELSVRCTRETDTVWMEVDVSDTGMGIPRDDMKNLFIDYYQVAASANRNIEGTGLGLPITKKLVEMMDGEIGVESEYGKGSKFSFRLKQGFVNDTPIGADVSDKLRNFCYADDKRIVTKKLVRVNLSYVRVLVVDDMQTNLDVASGILRKYQMQVDVLSNGPDTIERIRRGTPVYNAIFMDHMMPGMDGIETADKIRALDTEYAKNVPIIALTANAIQGTDKLFYEHDFQAFITKPIDIMEMDTVLRKWVYDNKHEHAPDSGTPVSGAGPVENEDDKNMAIKISGVDTKKGLSLYAGETDIYLPLLHSYAANTPGTLEKLRSVSAETLSDYVISVHGLKGTSAGIGAEALREAALELENLSRAGDLRGVLAKNGKLIADAEIIVANVKAWLGQYDAQNAKPRLKAPDRRLLAKLRQYCESYNMSGIDEIMSELVIYDYEKDADLVAWLKGKIDISEFGEVVERLVKYQA